MTDIHTFFNLSYINILVLEPRHLLDSPELTAMIDQLHAAYAHRDVGYRYVAVAGEPHEVGDLTDEQLRQLDMHSNADTVHEDCDHPDPDSDEAWECERDNLSWYDWRGDQWDRDDVITVPTETLDEARDAGRIVLHRSYLQSMPDAWQQRFVQLLEALPRDDDTSYQIQVYDAYGSRTTDPVPHYLRGRTYIEPNLQVTS